MDRLLVVIFGLMGVGKTTVARALGEARGWPVIHSDAVRKALAGLAPTTPALFEFGQGIYSKDFSQKTYTEMRRRAGELLDSGDTRVILDASFKSVGERDRVRELAERIASNTALTNFAVTHALPRIAESDPAGGYAMEALMSSIAQADREAKTRLKAFLDKRAPKVTRS